VQFDVALGFLWLVIFFVFYFSFAKDSLFYNIVGILFGLSIAVTAFSPFWGGVFSLKAGFHYAKTNAAQMLFLLMAFAIFIHNLKRRPELNKIIKSILFSFTFYALVYLSWQRFNGFSKGLMGAYTFETAIFLMVSWTCINERSPGFMRALNIVVWVAVCLIGKYTVALCTVVGVLTAIDWQLRANKISSFALWCVRFSVLSAVVMGVAKLSTFLTAASRFDIWRVHLTDHFSNLKLFLIGAGAGSFEWHGLTHPVNNTKFVLMHNDYLQIFFEFGAPLALLFIIFVFVVIWRLRNKPHWQISATMYAATMLVYHPMHHVPALILGALIVAESMKTEEFPHPDPAYAL